MSWLIFFRSMIGLSAESCYFFIVMQDRSNIPLYFMQKVRVKPFKHEAHQGHQ